MTSDRWQQISQLLHEALMRQGPAREAFLAESCRGDEALRGELDSLLAQLPSAQAFLERPAIDHLSARMVSEEGAESPASITGRILGHYLVGHLLGVGGMGVVYAARDIDLERVVALKIVSSDVVDGQVRLRREAQRASQLNHPNVCTIHEVGEANGLTYFVMEHVDGRTLSALIEAHELPLEDVLRYGGQIAEALAHAHRHGLVHRDLKSSNVMVTRDERIKVLDFGLACPAPAQRVTELSQSQETLSRAEHIAGTLAYMAPELLRGEPADTRSDVWALGIVLHEMATGRRPFHGRTGFEISAAILNQPLESFPAHVSQSLQEIIRRSLAKNPAVRYAHAAEVAAAIDAARTGHAVATADQPGRSRTSGDTRPVGNLSAARTSFVGRVEESVRFARELETNRLVTLSGVGGSGKTRLALRIAEQLQSAFRDGVWWVDLAPIADATRVEEAVAATLGVLNSQRPPREALVEYLSDRRLLLVLDNCEHLIAATADLSDAVLAKCDAVQILATSREGLGIPGERILAVPALSLPAGDTAMDPETISRSDAVRLFAERAAAVHAGFSITTSNGPGVLDICRRLDGIPLAIELAAAHARVLSVEQIRARLADSLAVLSGRGRAVPRHQTLSAALQWSYDLLAPTEQRTLRLLSVFRGEWTFSAARAVCSENRDGRDLLDLVWRLVEKSLVEVVQTEGVEARYRLLEMVRQFAFDRLLAASEASDAVVRHAEFYISRFQRATADLIGPREAETVASLDLDFDNLLAALYESTTLDGGAERVLRLASDGWLFWVSRGRIAVGRNVLAAALSRAAEASTPARARALMASSMLARFAGDSTQALRDAEISVSLYEQSAQPDSSGLAFALFQRAAARFSLAERALASQDLERGVDLSKRAGDQVMMGICLNMLAGLALGDGDADGAELKLVEALSTGRASQSPYLLILYLMNLSSIHADRGRWSKAVDFDREALEFIQASGNRHFAPGCVLLSGRILAASGDLTGAWRLFGAALGMWAWIGETPAIDGVRSAEHELTSRAAKQDHIDYARYQTEGRALTYDAAVVETLNALQRVRGARFYAESENDS